MKRPGVFALMFIAFGIVSAYYAQTLRDVMIFILLTAALVCLLLEIYRLRGVVLLGAAAFIGFALCCAQLTPSDAAFDGCVGQGVVVSGVVYSVSNTTEGGKTGFGMEVGAYASDTAGSAVAETNVRLKVYGDKPVRAGDTAVVKGVLTKPSQRKNPSDFDNVSYMLARGQRYIIYADEINISRGRLSLRALLQRVKERTIGIFYDLMPQREAELMCGMLLGETGAVDSDIKELYKKTGIYHVLAISGLHITLLAGILLKLLSRLGRIKGRLLAALLLGCYCILTGCSVSAVRAVLMFYIMIAGGLLFYEYDLISAAAVSACILLLYSPMYLFDVGFRLSFGAVFAIGAASAAAESCKRHKAVIGAVGVNAGVDLVTKPILMYHFYYITPWSIIANLLLVPLMSAAVGLGFLTAAAGFVSLRAARLIAVPVVLILRSVENWCVLLLSLPYSVVITGKPCILYIVLYAFALIAAYIILIKGRPKYFIALGVICLCLGCGCVIYNTFKPKPTQVTFLSVGQADCAVVKGKGYSFAVDGGKEDDTLYSYLAYSGIGHLDAAFISHTDEDHIKGITDIMGEIPIDRIYLPQGFEENEFYADLAFAAQKHGTEICVLKAGNTVVFNGTDKMECLYPTVGEAQKLSYNNRSMVNRFVCEGGSVLFTGDIEYEGEELLCQKNISLRADVLKLAHHGSDTSNSTRLLERVRPRAAVASAQRRIYGHPDKKVLDRLDELNIPCYTTEEQGAVTVTFSKEGAYINGYLEDNR